MLKEGDKAPAFDLETDSGGRVALGDFVDDTLVLYFYPRDNTPGCTRQAQGFSAARRAIETAGGVVVGVSRDSAKSHQSFRTKCSLDITLASDPGLAAHKAYGAWGQKTMYGKKIEGVLRTTYLIKGGRVARVFPNVRVDGHTEAVLQAIGELSAGGVSSVRIPTLRPGASSADAEAKTKPAAKTAAKKKPAAAKKKPAAAKKKPAATKKKPAAAKKKPAATKKKPAAAKKKRAAAKKKPAATKKKPAAAKKKVRGAGRK